jgi:hypothetical protein
MKHTNKTPRDTPGWSRTEVQSAIGSVQDSWRDRLGLAHSHRSKVNKRGGRINNIASLSRCVSTPCPPYRVLLAARVGHVLIDDHIYVYLI